jgi:hypothetical protein
LANRSDVCHAGYRTLLETALGSGYAFLPFHEHDTTKDELVCLLRHDVDSDLDAALDIARIEAELGVLATYFVMLRSPVYNAFSRANHELVERILELGHHLGLHYDPGFAPRAGRTHEDEIDVERRALAEMLGAPVRAVAFHQVSLAPGSEAIEVRDAVKATYMPGYEFIADPNKSDWVLEAFTVFRERLHPRVQLLVHPMWWVAEPGRGTEELWERALQANLERMQEQLLIERGYGGERAFLIEPAALPERPRRLATGE